MKNDTLYEAKRNAYHVIKFESVPLHNLENNKSNNDKNNLQR